MSTAEEDEDDGAWETEYYCDPEVWGGDNLEWLAEDQRAEFLALKPELSEHTTYEGLMRLARLIETAADSDVAVYSLIQHFEWLTFDPDTPDQIERAELVARFCVDEARQLPLFSVLMGHLIVARSNQLHHATGILIGLGELLRRRDAGQTIAELDTHYVMATALKLLMRSGSDSLVTTLLNDVWDDVDDTELVRRFSAAFEILIVGELKSPLPDGSEFRFFKPGRPENTPEQEDAWREIIGE